MGECVDGAREGASVSTYLPLRIVEHRHGKLGIIGLVVQVSYASMAERVGDAASAVERAVTIGGRHGVVVLVTKHPPAVRIGGVFLPRPLRHRMHHRDAYLVLEAPQVHDGQRTIRPRASIANVKDEARIVVHLVFAWRSPVPGR